MKQSTITLIVTVLVFALGIFSVWFFPLNGAALAGMVISTMAIVVGSLCAVITHLLNKEGN